MAPLEEVADNTVASLEEVAENTHMEQSFDSDSESEYTESESEYEIEDDIQLLMSLDQDQEVCNLCNRPKGDKIYRFLKFNLDAPNNHEGSQFDWVTCPKCSRSYHHGCLWGSIGEADATCFHCD